MACDLDNLSRVGFSETRKGCFGTSYLEKTSISYNNKRTIVRLCPNASQYVFWDSLHLTETANKFITAEMISDGISLIA